MSRNRSSHHMVLMIDETIFQEQVVDDFQGFAHQNNHDTDNVHVLEFLACKLPRPLDCPEVMDVFLRDDDGGEQIPVAEGGIEFAGEVLETVCLQGSQYEVPHDLPHDYCNGHAQALLQ
ncbi:Os12g0278101 [Oryza sativa Japonica Group]|uniref:Os12g0278101 protein n=1 Tax=Oryza sativa subsp. japonica TaxID=39947 RepID=A0A0P0Y8Z3_ORYSJ|nr:hypothetical protein EE612_058889 [Oryza sativa]BAT16691.1 Os12g0278101 [Oryza sativa Japonica Group]